jgi:hypothetical protein
MSQVTPPLPPDPGNDALSTTIFSLDEPPVIETVTFIPDTLYDGVNYTANKVLAIVTDNSEINLVKLNYSKTQGIYNNEINLSNTSGNNWEADLSINESGSFYCKITATDNSFQSVISDELLFIIQEGIPDPPSNLLANNITQNSFTLEWEASTKATSYFLEVSESSNFSNLVFNNNIGNVSSFDVTVPATSNTYYIRLKAIRETVSLESSSIETMVNMPDLEPTNHVENFRLQQQNRNSFSLQWDYSVGEVAHNGYALIISNTTPQLPNDGEAFTEDYDLYNGNGFIAIEDTSTSFQITIPGFEEEWSCMLIPFSGAESAINYKTDGTVPQITLFTPINDLPNAWINELHYDNEGTDTDENIEIIIENSAQYSIADFQLLLYNGSNGELQSSGTKNFPEIPDGSNGTFDIFVIPVPAIQNGPEAVALTYKSDIIQFLSFEGTFIATEGAASNLLSEDIGVEESTSTTPGFSLQLTGTGERYGDFVWQEPMQSTFGTTNTTQTLTASISNETSWLGVISESWDAPANWSNGVPQVNSKAIIPAGCSFYPALTTLVNCKTLVLESDASLVGQEYLPASTVLYVKRDLLAGRWQYITPPVQSTSSNIFQPTLGATYLITFNNTEPIDGNIWSYLQDQSLPLKPMNGYGLLSTREDLEILFIGTPIQQSVYKNLSYSLNGNNWNFIGNPYLGSLKWDSGTIVNTTNSAYIFDPVNKTYITIDSDGKINGGTEDGYIPSMQGFFVESVSAVTSSLDISSTVNSNQLFYKSTTIEEFVQIKVKGINGYDFATVKFSDNNDDAFNEFEDSRKLLYSEIGVPQVFFTSQNEKISIMQLNTYPQNLPLSISISDNADVTLGYIISESFNDSIDIILKDAASGEEYDIRNQQESTFTIEKGENNNRFSFSFRKKSGSTITSTPDLSNDQIRIFAIEGCIKITSSEPINGTIDIYNITGQKIITKQSNGNSTFNIPVGKGVFIIRITDGMENFSKKVIVK